MKPYLQLEDVTCYLNGFTLGPLMLGLEKKDYLILLGPTGCGKSTLLDVLAGLKTPDHGCFRFNQQDMRCIAPHKRRIGYVIQGDNLFPHLTVSQNIAFGLKYSSHAVRDHANLVQRTISRFGLGRNASQSVMTLSGGERRKTAIARSLIIEPELLLLDEPLSMLDHNGRSEMLGILKMIHEEFKTTTLHVTHDRAEAWSIAQNCAVMNNGRIEQHGTVSQVFREPQTRFVAEFTGSTNLFQATCQNGKIKTAWAALPDKRSKGNSSGFMVIRPEAIRITSVSSRPIVTGTVSSLVDFGGYFEVTVHLKNNESIKSHISLDEARRIQPNLKIGLQWNIEDIHFIQDDQHG